ncbi:hypothetical protein [Pseudomonas solani]|uniref:hypothetical protein n=1 Tax=Pseudomonas solani TaxID=2731552 RepID=UPI003D6B5BE4
MKGILLTLLALLGSSLICSATQAEVIAFDIEQGQQSWAFLLRGHGQVSVENGSAKATLTELNITNNKKHKSRKWIDYIKVGLASRKPDGSWEIAQNGTPIMVNKILEPGERFIFKGDATVSYSGSLDSLKRYWVVITLGTNDGATIYAHAPKNVFGEEVEATQVIPNELQMREILGMQAVHEFNNEQFERMSEYTRTLLTTGQRTTSGIWHLTAYDAGLIESVINYRQTDESWSRYEDIGKRWIDTNPDSAAAYVTYAKILIYRAWAYRNTKSGPEFLKKILFEYYLNKAESLLSDNKAIASADPRWYEAMFLIATAERWDQKKFSQLEDEGYRKFPYYYQMYFVAFDYYSPTWGGSHEQIEKFAQKAVTYTAQNDGRGMYARVYWYASQRYYGSKLFTKSKVVWSRMSSAIDDVLSQYPDQWNINNFAYFSCLSGDVDKTRYLISQIKPEPMREVWGKEGLFDRCSAWANDKRVN